MNLFKKLNHKKKSLQDELEDKVDDIERLNTKLISQQEEIRKDSEELEETRKANVDVKIQLEEAKRTEEVLKNQLNEK